MAQNGKQVHEVPWGEDYEIDESAQSLNRVVKFRVALESVHVDAIDGSHCHV